MIVYAIYKVPVPCSSTCRTIQTDKLYYIYRPIYQNNYMNNNLKTDPSTLQYILLKPNEIT